MAVTHAPPHAATGAPHACAGISISINVSITTVADAALWPLHARFRP